MWTLSQDWYGDRLAPDYRPRALVKSQQLLTKAGLTEPFWALA